MFRVVAIAAVSGVLGAVAGASCVMLLQPFDFPRHRGEEQSRYRRAKEIVQQAENGDIKGAYLAAQKLRYMSENLGSGDPGLIAMLGVLDVAGRREAARRLLVSELDLTRITMSRHLLVLCRRYHFDGKGREGVEYLASHKNQIPPDMWAYYSAYLLHPLGERERAEALVKPLEGDPWWKDWMPPQTFDPEWPRNFIREP